MNGLRAIEENDLLTNPTGLGIRDDSGGSGYFNAPRGNRLHEGIDFSALAGGQNVVAPDSGTITNFTGRTSGYPMARIVPSNPNAGYEYMEILYIDRPQGVREWVSRTINAGDIIGSSVNLQSLGYPANVGPHIHLQMFLDGTRIDHTPFFFR